MYLAFILQIPERLSRGLPSAQPRAAWPARSAPAPFLCKVNMVAPPAPASRPRRRRVSSPTAVPPSTRTLALQRAPLLRSRCGVHVDVVVCLDSVFAAVWRRSALTLDHQSAQHEHGQCDFRQLQRVVHHERDHVRELQHHVVLYRSQSFLDLCCL